jgi:competence protein ComEC
MFSFVAIGYQLRRSVNVYHTLLVSIFLILLFNRPFIWCGFSTELYCFVFHNLAAALTSFYLEPKKQALKYIWEYSPFPLRHKLVRCLWVFIIFISFRFIFHHEPRSHPLLSFIMTLGILVMVLASFNYVPLFLSKPLGGYLLSQQDN